MTRISVIIPTLNEQQHVDRAIRSVSFADEVFIADGGSEDDTVTIATQLDASVVTSRPGRGVQLRAGAAEATGDVLLFLHADNWLRNDCGSQLRSCVAARSEQPVWSLFGCFRQAIDDPRYRFRLLESGNAFRATKLGVPYGDQAMFVDRTSYERAGGFAEVPLMEDVMLSRSLRKLIGRPILLDGPVHVNPRRWMRDGVVRRTLRNWMIVSAYALGVSPERLAKWYR